MPVGWNPWHGCKKCSDGCANCYVYRIDSAHGRNAAQIKRNADFDLPIRKKRDGSYKIPAGETIYTCFSSDFLLETADPWREEAWRQMRERRDLHFLFFTKRIERLAGLLPEDWEDGYENVTIGCSCENQKMADRRLPVFLRLPIRRRLIVCSPLIGEMDLSPYLSPTVAQVTVGGESGSRARVCDFNWVLKIRDACKAAGVGFHYQQTGAKLLKDGRLYHIERRFQHAQARKAGLDFSPPGEGMYSSGCE
ncbi:MAG: DUF5131 family protein [Candidatus Howiella sp.]|jgi:protein gp37